MAWLEAKIQQRTDWAPGLATIRIDAIPSGFVPGQFVSLALDVGRVRVRRSYSLASAANDPGEFYVAQVAGGSLTPSLFQRTIGETVWVEDRAAGFLTLERLPESRDLWLLATGTGLGPFMSMLRSGTVWHRYTSVVLVHGVRRMSHLGYRDELLRLAKDRAGRFHYVPVLSGDTSSAGAFQGRIPSLLASGELEHRVGVEISATHTHVLLCGNPAMITDSLQSLAPRGMAKHRAKARGHISFESYW